MRTLNSASESWPWPGRARGTGAAGSDRRRDWTVPEHAVCLRPHNVRTKGLQIMSASADDHACDTSISNRTREEGDAVASVRRRFRSGGPWADGDHN
jgi:hypothetical protein